MSARSNFDEIRAKIARSRELGQLLQAEARAWLSSSPLEMSVHANSDRTRWAACVRTLLPPNIKRWDLAFDESVLCIRTALDELLRSIAIRHSEEALAPAPDLDALRFPITGTPAEFAEFCAAHRPAFAPAVWKALERRQPFRHPNTDGSSILRIFKKLDAARQVRTLRLHVIPFPTICWSIVKIPLECAAEVKMSHHFSRGVESNYEEEEISVLTTKTPVNDYDPDFKATFYIAAEEEPRVEACHFVGAICDEAAAIVSRVEDSSA